MTTVQEFLDQRRLEDHEHAASDPPRRAASADGSLRERVSDLLRPERVGERYRQARDAPRASEGERARSSLRSVARAFLDRAAVEPAREIEQREDRFESPENGFEATLARTTSPADRRKLHDRWERQERELAPARAEWARSRSDAARRVGARSAFDLLEQEQAADSREIVDRFRRAAIEPLDRRIMEASRERRLRSGRALQAEPHAADVPLLESLAEHAPACPRSRLPSVLDHLAAVIGSGAAVPRLAGDTGREPWPAALVTREEGVVVPGVLDGPVALSRTLAGLGSVARSGFLRQRRGALYRWTDPAFDFAVRTLFRRLPLSDGFRQRFGLHPDERLLADLRLEEALAPRYSWAYLLLASEQAGSSDETSDPRHVEETLERAAGRPPTPGHRAIAQAGDPLHGAALRGTVLGLLFEERLLTRFGRRWFATGAAGRLLRECWEAEPDETADGMAAGLGLGTIEPTPILDGCRP